MSKITNDERDVELPRGDDFGALCEGTVVTLCCGAFATFSSADGDPVLCCRNCYSEVGLGRPAPIALPATSDPLGGDVKSPTTGRVNRAALMFTSRLYVVSHGSPPRGRGSWAFQRCDRGALDTYGPAVFAPGSMTLTEAKRWLREQGARGTWAVAP